jgi:hypothetical protein
MAKLTLLEIVQDILSDMVSDEVNSIDDTVEAQSVAQIVKTCYLEMIAHRNWPHTRRLVQFESIVDLAKPTYLTLPSSLKELVSFEYDCRKFGEVNSNFKEIKYKHPDDFLRFVSMRKSSDSNVKSIVDTSGVKLLVYNDRAPDFYTSFDDTTIVCDSYDQGIDDTLQTSKTSAIAYMIPSWERSDTAIPDLPAEAFPALVAEAKSTAFYTIKQMVNEKEEMKATRQNRWLSRKAWRAHGGVRYDDYGRKSRR